MTVSRFESDPRERGYTFLRSVEALREAVSLVEYAIGFTELRRSGKTLVGRCPLPDHEDLTPSFNIWLDNDSWWCFGCDRGSDVVDLYYHLHGCMSKWEALVGLSLECRIELPRRSESWHRAVRRKYEYRDAAYRVLGNVLKRRLYKTLVLPYIGLIEDPDEYERELERSWQEWADWWRWPYLAEDLISGDKNAFKTVVTAKAEVDRASSKATRGEQPS